MLTPQGPRLTTGVSFPSDTVLSRNSLPHLSSASLQNQVDSLVSGFVEQATDWKTLASLTAGGLAYRYGKMGVMGSQLGHVTAMPLRIISTGLGLVSEVTAFEFTNRTLQTFSTSPVTGHPSPSLWSWSGPGGWKQSLVSNLITFGTLKGAGYLGRESNLILQHTFASAAMVAGHNTAEFLGILPGRGGSRTAPTLAEQFLHAEATNLQLGAGTSLVHAMAPGVSALERGLDLSLQPRVRAHGLKPVTGLAPLQWGSQWALAEGLKDSMNAEPSRDPMKDLHIQLMASQDDGNKGGEGQLPSPFSKLDSFGRSLIEIVKAEQTWDQQALLRLAEKFAEDPPVTYLHYVKTVSQKGSENEETRAWKILKTLNLNSLEDRIKENSTVLEFLHFLDRNAGNPSARRTLLEAAKKEAETEPWAVRELDYFYQKGDSSAGEWMKNLKVDQLIDLAHRSAPDNWAYREALRLLGNAGNEKSWEAYLAIPNPDARRILPSLPTAGSVPVVSKTDFSASTPGDREGGGRDLSEPPPRISRKYIRGLFESARKGNEESAVEIARLASGGRYSYDALESLNYLWIHYGNQKAKALLAEIDVMVHFHRLANDYKLDDDVVNLFKAMALLGNPFARQMLDELTRPSANPSTPTPPAAPTGPSIDPTLLKPGLPFVKAKDAFEKAYLTALLKRNNYNITDSAIEAKIDRAKLRQLMSSHEIKRDE